MALKAKWATQAEIPVQDRAHYVEKDGAWVLDVEGDKEEKARLTLLTANTRVLPPSAATDAVAADGMMHPSLFRRS